MAIGRIRQRLNKVTSKQSVNVNTSISLPFISEQKILPIGEINHIVNEVEQFNFSTELCHLLHLHEFRTGSW